MKLWNQKTFNAPSSANIYSYIIYISTRMIILVLDDLLKIQIIHFLINISVIIQSYDYKNKFL